MNFIGPIVSLIVKGESGAAAAVQTTFARVLFIVLNILTGMITARALGPGGRGEQAAILLWPQFLAYILTLGVPMALIYQVKKHPQQQSQIVSTALLLSALTGCFATIVGCFGMPIWLSKYPSDVIRSAQWFMLFAPVASMSLVCVSAMEAAEKFGAANRGRYLAPIITLIGLSGLVLTHLLTPTTAALTYSVAGLLTLFWLLRDLLLTFPLKFEGVGQNTKRLLSYGMRSYGIDLFGSVSGQVDRVLVVGMLAPALMGIYTIALSLSRMLSILHSSTISVLFPKTSAKPVAEVVAIVGKSARVSTFLTGMTALLVGLFGGEILILLYGDRFVGAVPIFRILLLQVVLSGLTWVLAQTFMSVGKPEIPMLLQGIGLLINVVMMVVLIPQFSLVGASISLLVSTMFRLGVVLACYPLVLKVSPPSLWLNRSDLAHFTRLKQRFL
ncbi:oligosaccharide flippase family protein [filamentous cyanobacterium LEGE 11480]|uniref:Oligosaccharide flippase family protein n=1 Tax=Romeriopsis navalis LEGE 11480 TaxID=2777977 RepID=A0A928Z3Q8_9CYAN|nr:polysaccharide biosynthesis C-terminal domain-containing protein [Romeriopsis navalis]MBE9029540.1 oligosaccharide flippase family protein [Romeriopsis navalis LEGE 11480]